MEKDEDQKKIDLIVNKWHTLQQVIKEGITLNEISNEIYNHLYQFQYS